VAQLADALHKGIVGYDDVIPDGFLKFFLRHKTAGALSQMAQYLERLRPQFEFTLILAQATASQVQRKAIELKYPMGGFVHFSAPAEGKVGKKSSIGHLCIGTCDLRAFRQSTLSFAQYLPLVEST
jgi:hypothetical protein